MKLKNIKAIIFDLDDTLIYSTIDFNKMKRRIIDLLSLYGVKYNSFSNEWKTNKIIEKGERELQKKGLRKQELASILKKITEIMNQVELERVNQTVEIPNSKKILNKLKKQGLKLGIVTRSCRAYSIEALKRTGMFPFIDIVLSRDQCDQPKPDPKHLLDAIKMINLTPEEVVMIGDSTIDASCAKKANVKFIGVLTGNARIEEFKKIGCVDIVSDIKQIMDLLN